MWIFRLLEEILDCPQSLIRLTMALWEMRAGSHMSEVPAACELTEVL